MLLKDYSKEQIRNLVEIIKDCVREDMYTISLEENKAENIQFIEEYNVNEKKSIKYTMRYRLQRFLLWPPKRKKWS